MKRIVENQQDCFLDDESAKAYLNGLKNSSQARYRNFISNIKKLNIKGRYFEIGCGPGILTQKIAIQHPGVEIIANDISPEMIKLAQSDVAENLNEQITYKIGDACDFDSLKELGSFDLIYTTYTMHHWQNAETAITNLYSMLNENGKLYIHDLKRVFWLYYNKSKSGFFQSIRASYRPNEIKAMLNKIGIKNYKIKTIFPFFMQSILIRKD